MKLFISMAVVAITAMLSAAIALADDFKTIDGKEYKNATVSRVEPDGLVLTTKLGISKVYFVELPKDVQERFHYDAAKGSEFTTLQQAAIAESNEAVAAQQQQQAEERQRQAAAIAQQRQQAEEQQRQADAIAMRQEAQQAQQQQRYAHQQHRNATARQTAEQRRLRQVAGAAASQRAQEDQRIDRENRRNLENMQRKQALWNQQQSVEFARSRNSVMGSAESRENYKRELQQLNQLWEQQRLDGNRANGLLRSKLGMSKFQVTLFLL
jgi:hypothetical protein